MNTIHPEEAKHARQKVTTHAKEKPVTQNIDISMSQNPQDPQRAAARARMLQRRSRHGVILRRHESCGKVHGYAVRIKTDAASRRFMSFSRVRPAMAQLGAYAQKKITQKIRGAVCRGRRNHSTPSSSDRF